MSIEILTDEYRVWLPPAERFIELDLGCGSGAFLAQLAERYPERFVVGADVMLGRLRKVERRLRQRGIANAALLRASAWHLVGLQLPDGCVDRLHLLCPDPWPKDRHYARRLGTSEFLGCLARKFRPGGVFHFASDQQPYVDFVQAAITELGRYTPAPEAIADVADLKTDFEREFEAAGQSVRHLAWRVG